MQTIQKFLQACFLTLALVFLGLVSNAQCSIRSVVKHSCHNFTNGSIELKVEGQAPFQFQWNTGSQEQNLENLSAGIYSVTITDAKGSKAMHSVTINTYTDLQVKSHIEGSRVTAQVSGGKAPYLYNWISLKNSQKNVTQQATIQLGKGNYMLVVEDGNGCSATQQFKIN